MHSFAIITTAGTLMRDIAVAHEKNELFHDILREQRDDLAAIAEEQDENRYRDQYLAESFEPMSELDAITSEDEQEEYELIRMGK